MQETRICSYVYIHIHTSTHTHSYIHTYIHTYMQSDDDDDEEINSTDDIEEEEVDKYQLKRSHHILIHAFIHTHIHTHTFIHKYTQSDDDDDEEINSTDDIEEEEVDKHQLKRLGMGDPDPETGFLQVIKRPKRGRPKEYESSMMDEPDKTSRYMSDSV